MNCLAFILLSKMYSGLSQFSNDLSYCCGFLRLNCPNPKAISQWASWRCLRVAAFGLLNESTLLATAPIIDSFSTPGVKLLKLPEVPYGMKLRTLTFTAFQVSFTKLSCFALDAE